MHGAAAAQAAIDASSALFGQGDLAALDAATLEAAISELPQAAGGSGDSVAQLLVEHVFNYRTTVGILVNLVCGAYFLALMVRTRGTA